MTSLSLQNVRRRFDVLLDRLRDEPEQPLVVTEDTGEPALVVLSWAQYEALIETLDVRSDPDLMADIQSGVQEIEKGQTLTSEEAWQQLGW